MLSFDVAAGVAQTVLVALQAAWLTLGACDDLRCPEINRGAMRLVAGRARRCFIPESVSCGDSLTLVFGR